MDLKLPPPPPGNGCDEIIAMHQTAHHWNEFYLTHKGTRVYVDVSPCSWMNTGYGTQIKLSLKPSRKVVNAECVFHCDKTKPCENVPREKILEQGKQVAREWLAKNGIKPIERAVAKWAKEEPKLRAAVEREQERERVKQDKEDAKMKAKGATHRFVGWIHPTEGGDDYMVIVYTMRTPTEAEILNWLRKSAIKTDYHIVSLLAPPPYAKGTRKAREEAAEDKRMKEDGHTHKIRAMIHPPSGESFIKRAYSKGPFDRGYLDRVFFEESTVRDEYEITKL